MKAIRYALTFIISLPFVAMACFLVIVGLAAHLLWKLAEAVYPNDTGHDDILMWPLVLLHWFFKAIS